MSAVSRGSVPGQGVDLAAETINHAHRICSSEIGYGLENNTFWVHTSSGEIATFVLLISEDY